MEDFHGGTWKSRCGNTLPWLEETTSITIPMGQGNAAQFTPSLQRVSSLAEETFMSTEHIEDFEQPKLTCWNPHLFNSVHLLGIYQSAPRALFHSYMPFTQPTSLTKFGYKSNREPSTSTSTAASSNWLLSDIETYFIPQHPHNPPIPQHCRAHELSPSQMPSLPIFCWDIKISELR